MMTLEEMKQIQQLEIDWDWEKFRRGAAKDMLSAIMVQNGQDFFSSQHHPFIVEKAIELADELIRQLKEEKNEGK